MNAEVDTAVGAEDALCFADSQRYDAILIDIRMPNMKGIQLLQRLRRLQPETPVVLMTGHGEELLRTQAAKAGAYAFLSKPLDPKFLVTLLQQAIHHTRASRSDTRPPC
jgi:DNA-binding NtrC family response regulator